MKPRKFSPEQAAQIVRLYLEGNSSNELAARFDCSQSAIADAIKRSGARLRNLSDAKALERKFSPEESARVASLYLEGKTTLELAEIFSCSQTAIARAIKRSGHRLRNMLDAKAGARRFDPEQSAQIAKLYAEGQSTIKLARTFGSSKLAIRNAVRRSGGTVRESDVARRKLTPEQAQQVAKLYADGASTIKLAKQFDCTTSTIARAVRRAGGQLRDMLEARRPKSPAKQLPVFAQAFLATVKGELPADRAAALARERLSLVLKEALLAANICGQQSEDVIAQVMGRLESPTR